MISIHNARYGTNGARCKACGAVPVNERFWRTTFGNGPGVTLNLCDNCIVELSEKARYIASRVRSDARG